MISFDGLSKHYDAFVAVNKLSFLVQQGEVFGFLGPNGAGKTTTIRMLMGILVPTAGHAKIAALDCQLDRIEVKRRVGYLPLSVFAIGLRPARTEDLALSDRIGSRKGRSSPFIKEDLSA